MTQTAAEALRAYFASTGPDYGGEAANLLADHAGELLAALEDQRRYRWLRDESADQWEYPIAVSQRQGAHGMHYVGPLTGKTLDEAIDTAMQASIVAEDAKA